MSYEFTADEIKEVIGAARIFCPGFSEEQYQNLMELGKRLADSGYLEAVHGLTQLEKEEGVLCTEARDRYKQLLHDTAQLEDEVASLQEKLVVQQNKNQQAEDKYRQIKEATGQAEKELEEVKAEREREEKELIAFRKKAEKEKQCIDREIEEYRQKANVTKEEAVIAGQIKAQVESYGFSLELALDLSQEFAGHESAREKLSRALTEHRTLSNYIANLKERGEAQKKALKLDLDGLQSEKDRRQTEIKSLEETRRQLETIISQLRADVTDEQEIRRFYNRYYGREGLLECLASWDQIFFFRCNNPLSVLAGVFDRSAAGARFWTDKAATRCPHCGLTMLLYDEKPYQTLSWPVGDPLRLQLGE